MNQPLREHPENGGGTARHPLRRTAQQVLVGSFTYQHEETLQRRCFPSLPCSCASGVTSCSFPSNEVGSLAAFAWGDGHRTAGALEVGVLWSIASSCWAWGLWALGAGLPLKVSDRRWEQHATRVDWCHMRALRMDTVTKHPLLKAISLKFRGSKSPCPRLEGRPFVQLSPDLVW